MEKDWESVTATEITIVKALDGSTLPSSVAVVIPVHSIIVYHRIRSEERAFNWKFPLLVNAFATLPL